jgi:hypothetical protein
MGLDRFWVICPSGGAMAPRYAFAGRNTPFPGNSVMPPYMLNELRAAVS